MSKNHFFIKLIIHEGKTKILSLIHVLCTILDFCDFFKSFKKMVRNVQKFFS